MVRQVTPVHVDFGRRMYSPSQRVNQICGIFPDEIGRMNVPEFSGDRNEVVNAARLEESFLRVQTKLDRGDAIAVQNHVEVSPETPGRSYCTKSIKINIAIVILGPHSYPESLIRVQKLTGKSLTFYEADLCDKDALRPVFSKVKIII